MAYMKYVWLFVIVQLLMHGFEMRYGLKRADMDSVGYWVGTFFIYLFMSSFAMWMEPKE